MKLARAVRRAGHHQIHHPPQPGRRIPQCGGDRGHRDILLFATSQREMTQKPFARANGPGRWVINLQWEVTSGAEGQN